MAPQSIKIKIKGDPAIFDPPNLQASPGDVVFWDNTTPNPHQVWELDDAGNPVRVPLGGDRWAAIQPNDQSPAWTVPQRPPGTTIRYGCSRHNGEAGAIIVT